MPGPSLLHPDTPRRRVLVLGDSTALAHAARAWLFAKRLDQLGHQVTYATSRYHTFLAEGSSIPCLEIASVDPADAIAVIRRGGHIFTPQVIDDYLASDRAVIRAAKPDVVVSDLRLTAALACPLEGVEHHAIVNAYLTGHFAGRELPPQTIAAAAPLRLPVIRNYFNRIRDFIAYQNLRAFRKRMKAEGLPSAGTGLYELITSPTFNYVADDPTFMPLRPDAPDHFSFIGPLIWEPAAPTHLPDWWPQLLECRNAIYVSMGSTAKLETFNRVLQVLAAGQRPVVATIGRYQIAAPDHVWSAPFLPASQVLPHCAAVVCHGGNGTLYQAFAAGVPAVAIPTMYDQELNADRLHLTGRGIALHPTRWSDTELIDAVEHAIKEPAFRSQLEILHQDAHPTAA